MLRCLLAVSAVLAATFVSAARAEDQLPIKVIPKSKTDVRRSEDGTDPKVKIEDAATKQELLKRQFNDFKQKLLGLAQRMENSTKPEEREKAKILRQAIQKASEEGVDTKFTALIDALKTNDAFKNTEQLQEVLKQNEELRRNLREIMELLLKGNRDIELKQRMKDCADLLKELNKVIHMQELVLNKTQLGRTPNKAVADSQRKVKNETHDLVNPKGDKDAESKPGGDKDGKPSAGKDGKPGSAKPSESKPGVGGSKNDSESKPDQGGQPGQPSEGKGGQQQPLSPEQTKIKKKIEDVEKYQERAEDNIRKGNRPDATEDEQAALKRLEEIKKQLEDLLRQLREEEIERLLAQLKARCELMLRMQIAVRDDTVGLDKVIKANPKAEPTRADQQASNVLSDREDEIIKEATAGLRLLEAEGSAVAFAEVFKQVRDDMITVATRLRKTDTGVVTVTIENQIIETLQEMIEALKKAQANARQRQQRQQQQQQQGQPQDPKLIDLLAELKMIRSMQKRVNARTDLYGKQYAGEQAPSPEKASTPDERERYERIQNELKDLSKRQQKISKVAHDIATGKNESK